MMPTQEGAGAANGRLIPRPEELGSTETLGAESLRVETRYGVYGFGPDNRIAMPQGLVGFTDHRVFGLANLPDGVPEDFKLLQSLDAETPLSFIVMPLAPEAAPIEPADLTEACTASGIEVERACLLYVVTVRPKEHGQGVDLTANFKAPIVLDLETRRARQHVLSKDRYPVRHPLTDLAEVVNAV